MPIDPYYYQSKLRDIQGQRALTTGRGLSPEETTGILNSELDARYAGEDRRRQYAIQQQQLAIQQDAAKRAGEAANVQAIAGTVGGVGQLALGGTALYGMGKQAGWWGATQGGTPAITSGGFGTTAGQTPAWGGVPGQMSVIDPATGMTELYPATSEASALTSGGMGSISSVALPVAAAVGDIWNAEELRKGKSAYGKGGQAMTPWNDSSKWGVAANLTFPMVGAVGGIVNSIADAIGGLFG